MTWTEILKSLVFWGPGAVIAGVIIFALYKLATNIGMKFIDAQNEQSSAVVGLTRTIEVFFTKDNSEHREIIILIKVMMEKMERMEEAAWTQEKNATRG